MKATYNILIEYDISKYNERLHSYERITEEESKNVIDNGYIVPSGSAYYKLKNIFLVMFQDGKYSAYKATRKV